MTAPRRVWRALIGRAAAAVQRSGRLPYWRYRLVITQLPVACVDLLPVRDTDAGIEVGLIKRRDELGQLRWAMIGGGVHRNETLDAALERHVHETLGDLARVAHLDVRGAPAVGQYFPERRPGHGHDPRKHAIALSYWAPLTGTVTPGGEAEDFRWFSLDDLPPDQDFGYGHEIVVVQLVEQIRTAPASAGA